MNINLDEFYKNKSLQEKEEILDVYLEKTSDMEKKIYKLWDITEANEQKLLKDMLSSITIFKISCYESKQEKIHDKDLSILKMGRFLSTTVYAYLNTKMRETGFPQ